MLLRLAGAGLRLLASLIASAGGTVLLTSLRRALLTAAGLFILLRRLRWRCLLLAALGRLLHAPALVTCLGRIARLLLAQLIGSVWLVLTILPVRLLRLIARRTLLSAAPLASTRRHGLGGPRRRGGIDFKRLPCSVRDIRLIRTRVNGHAAVFKHAPRPSPDLLRHQLRAAVESSPDIAVRQHDFRLSGGQRAAVLGQHAGLDAHADEAEVGIERPHPDGHRSPRRHPHRRFSGLLDRDLGSQVRQHLDAVLQFLRLHLLPAAQCCAPRLKEQPVGGVLSGRAVGVHLQHKRAARPR